MTHSHMILDWRLYASLHAMMVLLYLGSLLLIGGRWFGRYWAGTIVAWALLSFVNFLDWLWS